MKMPNVKTMLITTAVAALVLGWVMKSGRDAVKSGSKVDETIAGKLGLIS